jgi:hypothetical protein
MAIKGPSPTSTGPNSILSISWHVLALGVFTFAFQSLDEIAKLSHADIDAMFGGHYQFLTILGLWASRLGMGLALLNDFLPTSNTLKKAKSIICVAALPTETLISVLYWTIMSISPDLLIPPLQVADPDNPAQFILETVRIPLHVDLSMHAAPAVFLLVVSDHWAMRVVVQGLVSYLCTLHNTTGLPRLFAALPKEYPTHAPQCLSDDCILVCRKRDTESFVTFFLSFGNSSSLFLSRISAWAEVCAHENGNYPYPLLEVLSAPARITLYIVCAAVFVAVLEVVDLLHSSIDKAWNRSWDQLGGQEGKGVAGEIDKKKKEKSS